MIVMKFMIAAGNVSLFFALNSLSVGMVIPIRSKLRKYHGFAVFTSTKTDPTLKFNIDCPKSRSAGLLNCEKSANTVFIVKVLTALIKPYTKHIVTTNREVIGDIVNLMIKRSEIVFALLEFDDLGILVFLLPFLDLALLPFFVL
jgi:hypothetical protein